LVPIFPIFFLTQDKAKEIIQATSTPLPVTSTPTTTTSTTTTSSIPVRTTFPKPIPTAAPTTSPKPSPTTAYPNLTTTVSATSPKPIPTSYPTVPTITTTATTTILRTSSPNLQSTTAMSSPLVDNPCDKYECHTEFFQEELCYVPERGVNDIYCFLPCQIDNCTLVLSEEIYCPVTICKPTPAPTPPET